MKHVALALTLIGICWPCVAYSQLKVLSERTRDSSYFQFETIPIPAIDDAAAEAKLEIVKGKADPNSAALTVLTDGRIPVNEDSPSENFFFAVGTAGGCIATTDLWAKLTGKTETQLADQWRQQTSDGCFPV